MLHLVSWYSMKSGVNVSAQLTDWYTRLMRDEIVAEWRGNEQVSLHVHCHVSGGHVLLAPAALRNSIFEREMPLVSSQSPILNLVHVSTNVKFESVHSACS